jgi:hypothetical protein
MILRKQADPRGVFELFEPAENGLVLNSIDIPGGSMGVFVKNNKMYESTSRKSFLDVKLLLMEQGLVYVNTAYLRKISNVL